MSGETITTALACGDKGWTFYGDRICLRTVGQIRVIVTDSGGLPDGAYMEGGVIANGGENYAPMSRTVVEKYMCVETGIGTGSIYTLGKSIFLTEEECRTANAARFAELEREKKQREDWLREQRIQRLRSLRSEISHLKARLS